MNSRIKLGMLRLSTLFACAVLTCSDGWTGGIAGDGTMNPTFNGDLVKTNGVYAIKQEFGKTAGTNLFHSFAKFGLTAGETADFQGSAVSNIISRVTGGTKSEIDGTIKSSIAGANLYLMNPKGVMFGPNASLDVSGSFHVTTADYLKFGEEGTFNANPSTPSQMLKVNPSAFGFLSAKPAAITFSGSGAFDSKKNRPLVGKGMQVQNGKTLSVVGGDVSITADQVGGLGTILKAPGGRVNLVSVGGAGDVVTTDSGVTVNTVVGGIIQVDGGSVVMVSDTIAGHMFVRGQSMYIGCDTGVNKCQQQGSLAYLLGASHGSGGTAGNIDISMNDDFTIIDGSTVSTPNRGDGVGGSIILKARNVNINNKASLLAETQGVGAGGDIDLSVENLSMSQGVISTSTTGTGNGGAIRIKASNKMTVAETSSITSNTTSKGQAGKVIITDENLYVLSGSSISSSTYGNDSIKNKGDAGNVEINSKKEVKISGSGSIVKSVSDSLTGFGSAGRITIDATNLSILDGGEITISSWQGEGGQIKINASETVTLRNGSFIDATSSGSGRGGDIRLALANLVLQDGAKIRANVKSQGEGGGIFIRATNDVIISGQGSAIEAEASEQATSQAGLIMIDAKNNLFLNQGGGITVTTRTVATSGDIFIWADNMILSGKDTVVQASTRGAGKGGTVSIYVTNLDMNDESQIVANTLNTGSGGNITIDASGNVILNRSSLVEASSANVGEGGSIHFKVANLLLKDGGSVSANAVHNKIGGRIDINASGAVTFIGKGSIRATTSGNGPGGKISLDATKLSIYDGGYIKTTATKAGNAGSITINASGNVILVGNDSNGYGSLIEASSISSEANKDTIINSGEAGKIILKAANLVMNDGGSVKANTDAGRGGSIDIIVPGAVTLSGEARHVDEGGLESSIQTKTKGYGVGGDISMQVGRLSLNSTLITASTNGFGAAGTIAINATEEVILSGAKSAIDATTFASGSGGAIRLDFANLILQNGAKISANANKTGLGGGVSVIVKRDLTLSGNESAIAAEAADAGAAGYVQIKVGNNIFLNAGGKITVSTKDKAASGGIDITAKNMTLSAGTIQASTLKSGAGGNIRIDVADLILNDRATISANTDGTGEGGGILIKASGQVTLNNGGLEALSTGEIIKAGQGGAIELYVANFFLKEGGFVNASTVQGVGGSIFIKALGEVNFSGKQAGLIRAMTSGSGHGGTILVEAAKVLINDGGRINSTATESGNAGSIMIKASGDVTMGGNDRLGYGSAIEASSASLVPFYSGEAGKITIKAANLVMNDGGSIKVNTNAGLGGSIDITAPGAAILSGQASFADNAELFVSSIQAKTNGIGNGGRILMDVGTLSLNGAIITSSSTGKMIAPSSTETKADSGAGGSIELKADKLNMAAQSEIVASTAAEGGAGHIKVTVKNTRLVSGSKIASNSDSMSDVKAGDAGAITLVSRDDLFMDGSLITSTAKKAGGGDITVEVDKRIFLTQSTISTSVQGGDGKGGNISIDPINLILKNSHIKADANKGEGGKVTIKAQSMLKNPSSSTTASSNLGVQGTVTVDTPNVNPVDSLSALPVSFFDASALLSERCSARRGSSSNSSFVMKGRGGLPLMPGDLLASHGLSAHYPVIALGENSDSFNMVSILENDAKVLCLM